MSNPLDTNSPDATPVVSRAAHSDLDFFKSKFEGLKIPETVTIERSYVQPVATLAATSAVETDEVVESLQQQVAWADERAVRLQVQLDTMHSVLRLLEEENQRLKVQIASLTGDTRKLT